MKTLYLDLGMGAAGDMLTASLLDLFDENEQEEIIEELNAMGIPDTVIKKERSESSGVTGMRSHVLVKGAEEGAEAYHEHVKEHHHGHDGLKHSHEHHHEHGEHEHAHSHTSVRSVVSLIDALKLNDNIKNSVKEVYALIARAESKVHGTEVDMVHFHEVGAMDAVADIAAVCFLMDRIAPDNVCASAVNTGSGTVRCAHGILPVPAPATAILLEGIPAYSNGIESELCTPTGAALVKYYVNSYGPMPLMRTSAVGYGLGKKEFEQANILRSFLGESDESEENVTELVCEMDDITGEEAAYALERIMEEGALEAYMTAVQMKKNRPGLLLTVLSRTEDKERILKTIFANTTTIGIREYQPKRHKLERSISTVEGEIGRVDVKISEGFGVRRVKAEYEDLARIAKERGLSISEVRELFNDQCR